MHMPEIDDRKCCKSYPLVRNRMSEEDKCITETTGFVANCLNADVLEVSVYEYIHKKGVLGDDEPEHR